MDTRDITWRLAQLASLAFQERYVIGGTKDKHVLDVELLEDVDALQYMLRLQANVPPLTDDQRAALEDLFSYIDANSEEALSAQTRQEAAALIRESDIWITLRTKAAFALTLFGLSPDMPISEIERLTQQ